MLKFSVRDVMPKFISSFLFNGESCLARRFLSRSMTSPVQLLVSCEGYDPNMAVGDELDGLLRFLLPDESEEESCVELSGDVEETAERGCMWGRGLCSAFGRANAPGDPKLSWALLDMGDAV
jgi:hypothetical protein